MALSLRDFRLMAMTTVATATLTTFAVIAISDYRDSVYVPPPVGASDYIYWSVADGLKNAYLDNKPLLVKYENPESPGDSTIDVLEGFIFEPTHLREIIANNGSADGNADEVLFFLGQTGTFVNPASGDGTTHGNLTLIAVGLKDKQLLINNLKPGRRESLFDKANPCPPYCRD